MITHIIFAIIRLLCTTSNSLRITSRLKPCNLLLLSNESLETYSRQCVSQELHCFSISSFSCCLLWLIRDKRYSNWAQRKKIVATEIHVLVFGKETLYAASRLVPDNSPHLYSNLLFLLWLTKVYFCWQTDHGRHSSWSKSRVATEQLLLRRRVRLLWRSQVTCLGIRRWKGLWLRQGLAMFWAMNISCLSYQQIH